MSDLTQTRITGDGVEFFLDYNQTQADVRIGLPTSVTDPYRLSLPSSLPDATRALTVDSGGGLGYTDLGESTLDGTFNDANDGAPGIETGMDTLSTTAEKLDSWIFKNLVDAPPKLARVSLAEQNTTSLTVCWPLPTIYQLGILDRTVPFITSLNLVVYKAVHTGARTPVAGTVSVSEGSDLVEGQAGAFATAITGGSLRVESSATTGTVSVDITASDTTVSGSGTLFTSELVEGVDIQIDGEVRTVVSIESDTVARVGRGWVASIQATTQWSVMETKVVTTYVSSSSIRVSSPYVLAYSNATATTRAYETTPVVQQTPLTEVVAHLPREGSDTTSLSAVRIHLPGNGSNGASGSVVTYNGMSHRVHDVNSYTTGNSITNDDILKVVVYYGNHNSKSNLVKQAYLVDVAFLTPGPPSAPAGFSGIGSTNSVQVSWTKPQDHDISLPGNQTTPAISQYKLSYASSDLAPGVNRFSGARADADQTVDVSGNTQLLNQLEAGQRYALSVAARNAVNEQYGAAATTDVDTTLPSAPDTLDQFDLTRTAARYEISARTLSNTSVLLYDVLRHGQFPQSGYLSYNELREVGVNPTNSGLEDAVHGLVSAFNGSNDLNTGVFSAFANPFPRSSSPAAAGTHTRLTVTNQRDGYASNSRSAGFWSVVDVLLEVATSSLTAREPLYAVSLTKTETGHTPRSLDDMFYVDDLTNAAVVTQAQVDFGADTDARYVSGVPTKADGFVVDVILDVQHLGRYFLRADKLVVVRLSDNGSSGPYASATITNTIAFQYTDGTAASTSPLSTSAPVRLATSLTFSDPANGVHTVDNNSYLRFQLQAFNLLDNSSATTMHSLDTGNNNRLDNTSKKIYVDTQSVRYLNSYYNKVPQTSGGIAIHFPSMVELGGPSGYPTFTTYPAYDHTKPINNGTVAPAYAHTLQFTGGRFRTKGDTEAYLNYSAVFVDRDINGALAAQPDYSGVSGTGFRYATFLFDLGTGSAASTITFFDIVFQDVQLPVQNEGVIDTSKFQLYVKLIDNQNLVPATNNYSSIWLNANEVLDTSVTRSQSNYSLGTNEPLSVLENTSSGNTNNSDTKRIVLVPGTSTQNLEVLVRVGLQMGGNYHLGHIQVRCPSAS